MNTNHIKIAVRIVIGPFEISKLKLATNLFNT